MTRVSYTVFAAATLAACSAAQVALCDDGSASAPSPPFLPSPTPKYAEAAGGIIGASIVAAALFFLLDCYLVPLGSEAAEGNGYDESSRLLDNGEKDSSEEGYSNEYIGRRESMPQIEVTSVNATQAEAAEVGVISDMTDAVSALSSIKPRSAVNTGAGRAVGRGKAPSLLSDPQLSAETLARSQAATHERAGTRARGPSRGSRASSDEDTSASRVRGCGASPAGRATENDMGVTDDEEEGPSAASSYTQRTGLGRLRAAIGGSTHNTGSLAPRPQSSSDDDRDD
jgi:hypothetical protein